MSAYDPKQTLRASISGDILQHNSEVMGGRVQSVASTPTLLLSNLRLIEDDGYDEGKAQI